MVRQPVVTRGSEHADLPHRTAKHPAVADGGRDEIAGTGQHGTRGGAEAFGEGDHQEVERRSKHCRRHA